jgi:hypothetical protein
MSDSKYKPEEDVILWESETFSFKPAATLKAQVKKYKNGIPKLLLVEEGIGFNKKPYSGYILKRLEIERLDLVIQLLTTGKAALEKIVKIL